MIKVLEFINGHHTVVEVANFCRLLTHLGHAELVPGTDCKSLADRLGIRVPEVLMDSTITIIKKCEERDIPEDVQMFLRYPEALNYETPNHSFFYPNQKPLTQ